MKPKLPLYHRIENDLKNKIFLGKYRPGDMLPSERELIEIYKVSRLTAREAVNRLAMQGLVEKIQGKGTFVKEKRQGHGMGHLYSGGEEILMKFYEIKTKVLNLSIINPDQVVCKNLELSDCEQVVYLERLRFANQTPVALIKSYLPQNLVPGMESVDFTDKSLYGILEETYRLQLHEAEEIIEAILADEHTAKLLETEPGFPVLFNQRITHLLDGTIVEYETVTSRSDIYKYHNKLTELMP